MVQNGMKSKGLWETYLTNNKFHKWERMVQMLKDLPPNRVVEGFNLLYDKMGGYVPKSLIPSAESFMVDYFQKTWLNTRYSLKE